MSAKKKAAGNTTSQAAKKKSSDSIIAVPLEIVNMSDEEIIDAAIGRLTEQDKEAKYDKYGAIMHSAVLKALCEFCRQNAEFARSIVETDKHIKDCLKAVSKGVGNGISDINAYSRAVAFYFAGATVSFKMMIDVGDGVLCDRTPQEKPLELSLDNLLDW